METTLRELAATTRLEPRRALLIMRDVVTAIGALHAGGKHHGNISPDTIVVTQRFGEDKVELRDGGAKRAGDPAYSPPGVADARSDLYAAGAVLFELLTGKPPFAADDADALRRLHAYAPRQTLKQRAPDRAFPDEVEAVVATAIAKGRDARFRDTTAMLDALDRALAVLEPPAVPPPVPGAAPKVLDESLLRLAQDLMPATSDVRISEPVIAANVSREVPQLPWYTRAELVLRRTLRRRAYAAAAGGALLVLVIAIVTCAGSKTTAKRSAATSAGSKAAAAVDLDKRCDALAHACGDTPKHVAKILEDCKAAATKQRARGCAAPTAAAYDCFENTLCKSNKIWALDDLRVLSQRQQACVAESAAMRECKGP